jgi:ATP-binding cassette subfamily B protein
MQFDMMDCGPTCLKMIASFYGKEFSRTHLRELASINREGVSFGGISEAAEAIGFETLFISVDCESLANEVPFPCIVHWRARHFVVLYEITKKGDYLVADPAFGLTKYSRCEFLKGWLNSQKPDDGKEGHVLVIEPTPSFFEEDDTEQKAKGFSFLFPYIQPYDKLLLQVLLGVVVVSLIQITFPFAMQSIVDKGINYQNTSFIYLVLFAQLILFTSQTIVQLIRSWLVLHVTGRVNIRIISHFLIKLMKLPASYFDSKNTGDLIQRIEDHNRIQDFLSSPTLDMLFSIFIVVIFGTILCFYSPKIFLIFLCFSAAYMFWVSVFMKKREELEYKRFDQASGNQSSRIQLISGMQEIKLNNSERRRRWEWENIQIKLFKISLKSMKVQQMQTVGSAFIDQLKNIIITVYAAQAVIAGEISLGAMLAIQYMIGQLNVPLNSFLQFTQSAQDAKISLGRLSEIHEKQEEVSGHDLAEVPTRSDIRLERVNFRYGGRHSPLVVNNIDLTIPHNKVTAIVGPSGCGKTTLVKMLLKVYRPVDGSIRIGNISLEDVSTKAWRYACGAVMQDGYIFADTIARNITESRSEGAIDRERLKYAVKVANIRDFIESLPSGYNTRIGQSGVPLSGGERQRILIARAVYKDPEYLFFDEATSALDSKNERSIMEKLEEFYRGRTVVVVAHRLSTVKNADQIIVMNNGVIIERGTHSDLTKSRGFYFDLVKNQLEVGV